MPSLEIVVRPAQTGLVRPLAFAAGTAAFVPAGSTTKVWGSGGSSIFTLHANVKATVTDAKSDEIKRTYDVVRIKNPDDETQFFEAEVMTGYQARNRIDQSRVQLFFEKTQASANVEIRQRNQTRSSGA